MLNIGPTFKLIVIYFQSLISALNHSLNLRYACGSPFVVINSIFLQKQSRGNQLIRRRLTRTISIGSGSRSRLIFLSGWPTEGYGGRCMELRREGRHGERGWTSIGFAKEECLLQFWVKELWRDDKRWGLGEFVGCVRYLYNMAALVVAANKLNYIPYLVFPNLQSDWINHSIIRARGRYRSNLWHYNYNT